MLEQAIDHATAAGMQGDDAAALSAAAGQPRDLANLGRSRHHACVISPNLPRLESDKR